jgi:signal recognition particle GTPase
VGNYLKEEVIKDNVKERLKDLYKDIIIDDIRGEVEKSKNEVLSNIKEIGENRKTNKEILNKLEQILIMVDMLESKEEKELRGISLNSKIVLILNAILLLIIIISFFV